MKRQFICAILSITAVTIPISSIYAAEAGKSEAKPLDSPKIESKSVNSPTAAEPVKPGTADKPPQPIAPGTLDAPPKPAAPGTLDNNVINPDVENRNKGKPKPL